MIVLHLQNDTGTKAMLLSYDHPFELGENFNHSEILEFNRQINVSLFTVLENDINLRNLVINVSLVICKLKNN